MRGQGRVFQTSYRDKKTGELKKCSTWSIQYSRDGKVYRESAGTESKSRALELLKSRVGAVGPVVAAAELKKTTVGALAAMLTAEYERTALRSGDTLRGRVAHLLEFFGADSKASSLTTDRLTAYQLERLKAGAGPATVNREMAALSKALTLAMRAGKIATRPYFPSRLQEPEAKQGFFEHAEYVAVLAQLPAMLGDIVTWAYYSGWRKDEILGLTWAEVDLHAGEVRLSSSRAKTKRARTLHIGPELAAVLHRRKAARRLDSQLVFHVDGARMWDFRKAWQTACRKAKVPGKVFHDLRRTAVRNMVRAGIPEVVAMRISGHKTRSVFDRYNIVSGDDLKAATARLSAHVAAQ